MPDTTSRPEPSETVLTDAFLMVATAVPGSRVLNEAHLPPATAEPSDLVKASPLLMEMLRLGMDPREVERRALGAKHLGSGLIDHIQKMTMAAIAMADMKVWAQRS